MGRPTRETASVASGVGAVALVAVCCAFPVLAPIGLVIGVGAAGSAALLRIKHRLNPGAESDVDLDSR